jgi:ubiquinol-cytochrome c reductase cytochrome c subunit
VRRPAHARAVVLALVPVLVLVLALAGSALPAPSGDGRALFQDGCASCHGPDGRGTADGPDLRGAGAAGADLVLSTGYMPLAAPDDQPRRKDSPYTDEQIAAIVGYVASLGSGPPEPDVDPARGDVAEGREVYTASCAGCHQIAGEGGTLPGAAAPGLGRATATQIGEAIRVGPYVMPRWSPGSMSDAEIDSVAAYVMSLRHPDDRGGWGIGHIGPIPEGMVAWLIGGVALILVARRLGERA